MTSDNSIKNMITLVVGDDDTNDRIVNITGDCSGFDSYQKVLKVKYVLDGNSQVPVILKKNDTHFKYKTNYSTSHDDLDDALRSAFNYHVGECGWSFVLICFSVKNNPTFSLPGKVKYGPYTYTIECTDKILKHVNICTDNMLSFVEK